MIAILRRLYSAVPLAAMLVLATAAFAAPTIETSAPTAIVMEHGTNRVLFAKNADRPTPPASLAKLMTLEVVFDQVERGRLSLDDAFTVSRAAARQGGASMKLAAGSKVALRDLIRGIAIQSGNDASVVVAEGVAGSVPDFVAMMNQRAGEIGLTKSRFANPHGFHHPDQMVTMRDLAGLAAHLIGEHPDHYGLFGETDFTFGGARYANRNPLLAMDLGADGLKTGYIAKSGYGLVGSAERDGRRIIVALSGTRSPQERAREARKLLEWGFQAAQQTAGDADASAAPGMGTSAPPAR